MKEQFVRTQLLLGETGMEALYAARVLIFGVGGVGSYVAEALARSGVGAIDVVDDDQVSVSNLNRQIIATWDTVGMDKVDAAEQRIHSINPDCVVTKWKTFYLPDTAAQFDFTKYNYIVDCIDTVTGKLNMVEEALRVGTPIISAMGTGNKLHPELLELTDISKTVNCPLARVMRKELHHRGINHLKVVYSKEESITPKTDEVPPEDPGLHPRRSTPGSSAFVPAAAGLIIAGEVVRTICEGVGCREQG